MNVAADKNFEKDVRDKVCQTPGVARGISLTGTTDIFTGINLYPCCWKSYYFDAPPELVRTLYGLSK